MKELLNNALEQLKIAKIHVNPRSLRKQISLFEMDDSHDVEFNGSKSTGTYQQHLYSFYLPCKRLVDEMMNDSLDKSDSIKREFDLYCFEIREFKHLFFPKDFVNVLLNRIEFHKSIPRELVNSEAIKKILDYFTVQFQMLELLEQLYLHRIAHLNKFAIRQAVTQVNPDYSIPTKQEISAYMSGQLSLFPKGSGITLIQWQRDKVAFIELFVSVYESNSVKGIDKPKITKKEFFGLLMWFFNIQIGNIDSTLQAAKNRKIEQKPYLKELMEVFDNYCARGL